MAFNRLVMVLSISCSLAAFGCGDDDVVTDGGGRTDAGPVTDGGPVTDSGPVTDGGGMTDSGICMTAGGATGPTDYFMGTDNCLNTEDMAAIAREDYGTAMNQSVSDVASQCGSMCAVMADPSTCTVNCIRTGTAMAVTDACIGCYAASVMCTIDNCIAACIADSTAPACTACRCGTADGTCHINCVDDVFSACSGVPSTTCD